MAGLIPQEIIRKKRDGHPLSAEDIEFFFNGFLSGTVADYQVTAMLMAIYFRSMSEDETARLTTLMRDSGEVFKWPYEKSLIVDKHSTGGIGDKTSIVLLPLCLLEGLKVPMIAGRGLGHTGGTLDKLESIGVNVFQNPDQVRRQMDALGGAFMGQTESVARLDRRLYAFRDVTATVESIPLIVGSILSKKLAEGISNLVMDVKYGSGAFMEKFADARELAVWLRNVGKRCGLNIRCLLTDMGSPLGAYAGNALEIYECIEILHGRGPDDTVQLTLELAANMIAMAHPGRSHDDIVTSLRRHLASGAAFEMFERIVQLQGGDLSLVRDPARLLTASIRRPVHAGQDGWISAIDTRSLGIAVIRLGGGRMLVSDKIDASVGLAALRRVGTKVARGDVIAEIHGNDAARVDEAAAAVTAAYQVSPEAVTPGALIAETLS
jgi:pyrimidine-nucleoside phosphorylase